MNIGDLAERLIQAAEIEHAAAHGPIGPAPARSLPLPYSFTQAEKNGWGTERLAEERKEFFESIAKRPTARQISEAEEAWGWLALVKDERERSALAAWARCMADCRREHFKDWCLRAGIHPETGRRRKDRALNRILAHISRSGSQHCETLAEPLLPDDPENVDIEATFPEQHPKHQRVYACATDDAFRPFNSGDPEEFDWAAKRNERRRQREAKKRKQERAAA